METEGIGQRVARARRWVWGWFGAATIAAGVAAVACGEPERPNEAVGAVSLAALPAPGERLLSFPVPVGVNWQQALFVANGSLRINDGVVAREVGTQFALAANAGATETNLGVAANTGEVWSVAPLILRDRAKVNGSTHSVQPVIRQNQTIVTGAVLTAQPLTPTRLVTIVAQFPGATGGDVILEPNQAATLVPNRRYGTVTVKSGARLTLGPGNYYLDSLDVQANGELRPNKTSAPVVVYAASFFGFNGKVVDQGGPPENLLIGYFGQSTVFVSKPFVGSIVAPNASLVLASAAAPGHAGSFFAKNVEVHQNTTVTRRPFPWTTLSGGAACGSATVTASKQYGTVSFTDGRASFLATRNFVLPEAIKVEQGNAGNQTLTLAIGNGLAVAQCTYRGGSKLEHPVNPGDVSMGSHYTFASCTNGARSGDVIDATTLVVHVDNGDSTAPGGATRVLATFAAPRPCPGGVALADLRQIYGQANTADLAYRDSRFATAGFEASVLQEDTAANRAAAATAQLSTNQAYIASAAGNDQLRAFAQRVTQNGIASPENTVPSALLAFAAEMRAALGRWRPSPRFNGSCPELISDAVVVDIVAGIVNNDRALYAASLGRAEAALQCTRGLESRIFAEALVFGYQETLARYPAEVRPLARRALMSGLLNLFLLVHDDTKVMGPTPLYDWFVANRVALGAVFAEANSVPRLLGLWLRHPFSDQLVQTQKICEVAMSGSACVSGGHLLDALTDPVRLGLGACTALETVTTVLNVDRGYICDRGLCAVQGGMLQPKQSGPLLDRLKAAGGKTQFGATISALQASRCQGPAQGGGGSGGGTGVPDLLSCASDGVLGQRGASFERCTMDALAMTRTLGSTDTRRGWARDPCRLIDEGGGDSPDPTDPDIDDPMDNDPTDDNERARQEEIRKWQNPEDRARVEAAAKLYGYTITPQNWADAIRSLANASFVPRSEIGADGDATPDVRNNEVRIRIEDDSPQGLVFSTLDHEMLHALMFFSSKSDYDSTVNQHKVICGGLGYDGCLPGLHCGPDSDCGSCSPSSTVMKSLLDCSITPRTLVPIPRGAGAIDPSPLANPASSSWSQCFASLPLVPPSCLAKDCPPPLGAQLVDGQCTCGAMPSGPVMPPINPCAQILCPAQSLSVALSTGCSCMPFGGAAPTLPPGSCLNCSRPVDPTSQQCIAQPPICYFQNRPLF